MLTLGGKPVEPRRPKLMFATHRVLDEMLRSAASSGNADSLMALAACVAAVVPTAAGPLPLGDMERSREWSATAFDALLSSGATEAEVTDSGLLAIQWLMDQMPRASAVEVAAGNSSAQAEKTTCT